MIRPEEIRDLLRKQPFQAFRIHLSNGQAYDLNHPELALVTKGTIIVSKPTPAAESISEGYDLVSVLHINSVEVLPASASSGSGNGAL